MSAINTTITNGSIPLKVDFSPQLTTIIGGRGSGKSSVLRFIRGVFNRTADLQELKDILSDHVDFYKRNDSKSKKGVLTDQSVIEIDFYRNGLDYRITASNIHSSDSQNIKITKLDTSTNEWAEISEDRFIDFFKFEHYSQKQIYEIAQAPNSLRERIDKAIEGLEELKKDKEVIRRSFLEKSTTIRTIQQQVAGKSKLQTEIKDLDDRIKLFQQSGISALLTAKIQFLKQHYILSEFASEMEKREDLFDELIENIEIADVDYKDFDSKYSGELSTLSKTVVEGMTNVKSELKKLQDRISHLRTTFDASKEMSVWKTEYDKNLKEFNQKKSDLEQQGIDDIANFEKLTQQKATKEKELAEIQEIETKLFADLTAREKLQKDYLYKSKEITAKRREFVSNILHDEKVKISIKSFRNQTDYVQKLRAILQKDIGFDRDIEALVQLCFNGNVETTIKKVREIVLKIRRKEEVNEVTGHFINLVDRLTDAQIDEIELMLPEDEIEVQYKPAGHRFLSHFQQRLLDKKPLPFSHSSFLTVQFH